MYKQVRIQYFCRGGASKILLTKCIRSQVIKDNLGLKIRGQGGGGDSVITSSTIDLEYSIQYKLVHRHNLKKRFTQYCNKVRSIPDSRFSYKGKNKIIAGKMKSTQL